MFSDENNKAFEIPPNIIINNNPNNNPSIATRLNTNHNPTTQFSILSNSNYMFLNNHNHNHNHNHAASSSINLEHQQTLTFNDDKSSNIDCGEYDEQEIKRLKRMISNRESARRSRMRKRKQLETLQAQVLQLVSTNHQLAEKLNHAMENNYHLLQENGRLRDESVSLRKTLADLLMSVKPNDLDEGSM